VLLPLTRDTGWFFDTELLVLAQRAGLRIHEVPVDWTDDTDSRVRVLATMLADLRGIARLGIGLLLGSITVPYLGDPVPPAGRRAGTPLAAGSLGPRPAEPELPGTESGGKGLSQPESGEFGSGGRARLIRAASRPGHAAASRASRQAALHRQLARFALIGAVSTIGYLALYLMLRSALPAQPANALSLLVTAVANTAANRRYTFGISGWPGAGRHHLRGLLAFGVGLAATAIALAGLHAAVPRPAQGLEVMVLAGASMAATLARFALQRHWVFGGAGQAGRYDSDPLGRQPGGGRPGSGQPGGQR
jgi:putative flippase GtrA